MRKVVSTLIFAGLLLSTNAAHHWGYPDLENETITEPEKWGGKCDTGKRQSPINLDTETSFKGFFSEFLFENYDDPLEKTSLRNTGHSVQIDVAKHEKISVSGGGLRGAYILEQMHWHWYSEHTVDKRRYPLEVHLVHHSEKYSNVSEAVQHKSGVAVLGILYHVTDQPNDAIDKILAQLEKIAAKSGAIAPLENELKPQEMLPSDISKYFRYDGSLTTPSCDESVVWTVFLDTLPISIEQVEEFKNIKDSAGKSMKNNFRLVQHVFNRPVTLVNIDSGATMKTPLISFTCAVILAFGFVMSLT